ncbi:hypothetical protein HUJ05_000434 [Dendroctonus ponderosae]|nr:hypothetical protein HUJ05_000434 [Dendroctonus ponderosae]
MTTDISMVRWDPSLQQQIEEDYEYDGGNSSSRLFERSRIKALADERESVQKKTFQKWVNSHLVRVNSRITDLYTDLRDGKNLIKLLEVLSGERLPRPTKGKMRIHCLENVDKALQFLKEQRVHLENMGSHDIVDGNPRLSLGLIWTIILRFQIQDITIEETDNQETKSAKDALLLWCQMKTAGYHNVNVRNFSTSWRDGLAFNALIHKHRPDLLQFDKLSKSNPIHNLNNAFNVAEDKLGLTKLLDAEDVFVEQPDEKSIITYVVTYYHYFSKMKQETVQGKRIGKVVGIAMENDRMIKEYEGLTSELLAWIEATISALGEREFANSLIGVQQQLTQFNNYRTVEKPPKFVEKGNLEILLFTLQSKMRANNQRPYTPKEGKMISDINKAWERLEKAEHERELALREELIRQEKLEQLAARFNRKASMRETWLSENQRLVSQDNFGQDLAAVEAAAKKHEAIETDILAYEERVQAVVSVAAELEAESYHDMERINARKDNVLRLWNYLLELLRARRNRLDLSLQLQQNFQEMLHILDAMEELKTRLLIEELGKHLMGVEDLLQKHNLLEADINILGDRVKAVASQSQRFVDVEGDEGYKPCDPQLVLERVQQLEEAYAQLVRLAVERRSRLEESRKLWQFYWDMADEDNWIKEKEQIVSTSDIGHDLTTVNLLLSKHKILENELSAHEPQLDDALGVGEELIQSGHFGSKEIQDRLTEIRDAWKHLLDLASYRRKRLEEAVDYHQLFADADDVDIWMLDTLRLVSSEDVGRDEGNAQSLLKKHKDVTDELKNYASVIESLHQQAEALGPEVATSPEVSQRLASIDNRYKELLELAKLRKQRLLDALSLYKLLSESDGVEQWISEKDRMLQTMIPARDIEDVEIMKHRYDGFEKEMNSNASRVAVVNQLARQLLHVEHPNWEQITARQNQLNQKWAELREKAEAKREELNSAHGVQTFHIECRETTTWIEDKIRILQETDSLEMDLTGIMTLQRRLSGMERDLAAIQAKLNSLQKEADGIEDEHPEEAAVIRERIVQIQIIWERLTQMLKERDAKLEEAGDLHRFLRDLDHFQTWLTKTQTDIASEDTPSSLSEAEKLLSQHQAIREEIDNYTDDYTKMMEYGEKITADPSTQDDPQYMFLRERLKALKDGWDEIHQMWDNRQHLLSQSLSLQLLERDARQAEVILNQQEHTLSKDETPTTLEQAENLLKRHEAFLATMEANDDKINSVVEFSRRLCDEGHFATDKIGKRADNLDERRLANKEKAQALFERLRDLLELHQYLRDCDELGEWIQEKHITAQDETYRSAKTVHSKWTRHQAFEAEIGANKERLLNLQRAGEELAKEKPEYATAISPKIEELADQFDVAMSDELGRDAGSVSTLQRKHQNFMQDLQTLQSQVQQIQEESAKLQASYAGDRAKEITNREQEVVSAWASLQMVCEQRRGKLADTGDLFKFFNLVRTLMQWMDDVVRQMNTSEKPRDVGGVELLMSNHQSLKAEIDAREDNFTSCISLGKELLSRNHYASAEITDKLVALNNHRQGVVQRWEERWENLQLILEVYQFARDAAVAEAWLIAQEPYLMSTELGHTIDDVENLIKKHEAFEKSAAAQEERFSALERLTTLEAGGVGHSIHSILHDHSVFLSSCDFSVNIPSSPKPQPIKMRSYSKQVNRRIVETIVLNCDQFYSPKKQWRRKFTLLGCEKYHPNPVVFSQKTFLHGKNSVLFSDDIKHICQAFLLAEQFGSETVISKSKLLANFDLLGLVSGNVNKQYGGLTFEIREMKRREEAEAEERARLEREEAERKAALEAASRPKEPEPASADRPDAGGAAIEERPVHGVQPRPQTVGSTPSPPKPTPRSQTLLRPEEKAKRKDRSRSKSPFRSFRWKKSSPKTHSGAHSDDEGVLASRQEGSSPDEEGFEGNLVRKHEWENTTVKASNRSWDKVFVVLRGSHLAFYKDPKTAKSTPDQRFKGEAPLQLHGATASVATDYKKKKHVFRLKLENGGDFLLQAQNDAEMNTWISHINAHADTTASGPSRSQTLPASGQKEDQKRRSFFTLKKT